MKEKICILYSTVDGYTIKICNRIVRNLEEKGCSVDLIEISLFNKAVLDYSIVIIGASVRYGKHNKKVTGFITNNKGDLDQIKTAFFSVNLVARKMNKNTYDSNPYVIKFFDQIDWNPTIIDVFAGRLDYSSYPFFDRLMIKLIMKITNGPTKTEKPIEFTDWKRVDDFSNEICQL